MDIAQLGIQVSSAPAVKGAADLDKLTVAAAKAEKSTEGLSAASKTLADRLGIMSGAAKSASGSADVFLKSLQEQDAAVSALRASIDPLYASSMKYAQAVEVLDTALARGAISQAQHTRLADMAAKSMLTTGAATARAGWAMGLTSNHARGLSQQLSQVGQMTMVTGNFTQALAVQLPDIGLAFGAIGAAAGLVAGVALPMIIAAFGGTSDSAEQLRETLERSEDAVASYVKAAEAALQPNEKLIESYGRLSGAAGRALQAMADVKQIEAINAVAASVKAVSGALLEWDIVGQQMGKAVYGQVLANDFGLAADQAARLQASLLALEGAKGLQNQATAADAVARELLLAYGSVEKMPPALQAVYTNLSDIVIQAGGVQGAMEKAAGFTQSMLAAATNLAGAFGGATAGATGLADKLADAASNAWEIARANAAAFSVGRQTRMLEDERGSQRDTIRGATNHFTADQPWLKPVAAGAGGGGTVADDFAARLQGITEGLQTERAMIDTWYADAQTILADRRAQEILGEQGHKQALLAVEQSYQEQLAALEASRQQQRLGETANFFGALAGIASAGGQRMAKAVATFQAVEGTVNAYGAAIKALNTPGLTIWGRYAAYASILAAGLKGVAAIRSAGGIGGGGGASASAPAAQAVQTQQQNQQTLVVQGIKANDIFTGQMIYDMFMGEGRLRGAPVVQLMR